MEILIRKENNGLIYIDKDNAHRFEELQMDKPPYNFIKISIGDIYSDCVASDFDDNLTLNYDKYNVRKQKENNEALIVAYKEKLRESDYKAIKFAEGVMSLEEYTPIKIERQMLRTKINELEKTIK